MEEKANAMEDKAKLMEEKAKTMEEKIEELKKLVAAAADEPGAFHMIRSMLVDIA